MVAVVFCQEVLFLASGVVVCLTHLRDELDVLKLFGISILLSFAAFLVGVWMVLTVDLSNKNCRRQSWE
jgi:hypothetical protein